MPRPTRRGPYVPAPSRAPERAELARLRRSLRLTQGELAERLAVSQSCVAKIETGQRHPSQQLLERLAAALGKSERRVEELLYGRDEVDQARRAS